MRGDVSRMEQIAQGAMTCPVPPYITLTEEASYFWHVMTSVRPAEDWLPTELLQIAKICQYEADLQSYRRMLAQMGPVIFEDDGKVKINPLVPAINQVTRTQLALMRSLSMMLAPSPNQSGLSDSDRQQKQLAAMDDTQFLELSGDG